jgi:2-hydroxy-3-keto-5-methylthiopentenyl-1-phosphate phosphatase
MAILSDGIEQFIKPILARAGAGELRIRSNAIDHRGTRLKLLCPHNKKECQSKAAHCKCASAKELGVPGRAGIYIGDGRSDLCPARTCQVVFAKGALARAFKEEGRPYYEFDTLHDVVYVLARAWSSTAG